MLRNTRVGSAACAGGDEITSGSSNFVLIPYEFMGFGAIDVTKPYKFIWFGDIHGPKPYKL